MEQKSKSQVKREMTALQDMGKKLVELTPAQIGKIEMPEDLREAVLFAKTLRKGEALRRQMQFIGVLMRDVDVEPIQKALDAISRGRRSDAQRFHDLEKWRDRLIDEDDERLNEILTLFPNADRRQMRQLVLNARKERDAGKPPRSSRALFRYLRELSGV